MLELASPRLPATSRGSPLKDSDLEIADRVGAQQAIEKSILTGS